MLTISIILLSWVCLVGVRALTRKRKKPRDYAVLDDWVSPEIMAFPLFLGLIQFFFDLLEGFYLNFTVLCLFGIAVLATFRLAWLLKWNYK